MTATASAGPHDAGTETAKAGPAERRADDLQLARSTSTRRTRSPSSSRRPASTVDYIEDVNDNNEFFGKLQPQLDQGESGGRSIFVVTDWMAKKMYDLGYLQNLDKSTLPTVDQEPDPDACSSPAFDPTASSRVPWQSGHDRARRSTPTWRPTSSRSTTSSTRSTRARSTMLTEMRDTVPLVMKADGIDPAKATKQDWLDAIDKLKATPSTPARSAASPATTTSRTWPTGDVVAAIGWSGDAVQLQADNPNIEFGCRPRAASLWSDNMVIPVGAPEPGGRLRVHELRLRAEEPGPDRRLHQLRDAGRRASRRSSRSTDPELANNELIFPSERVHRELLDPAGPARSSRGSQQVEQAFQDVVDRLSRMTTASSTLRSAGSSPTACSARG